MSANPRACDICHSTYDVQRLVTCNLCAICDSLGRLYAARTAYHAAEYQRGVERGYQGNVTVIGVPPVWAHDFSFLPTTSRTSGTKTPITFKSLAEMPPDDDAGRVVPKKMIEATERHDQDVLKKHGLTHFLGGSSPDDDEDRRMPPFGPRA